MFWFFVYISISGSFSHSRSLTRCIYIYIIYIWPHHVGVFCVESTDYVCFGLVFIYMLFFVLYRFFWVWVPLFERVVKKKVQCRRRNKNGFGYMGVIVSWCPSQRHTDSTCCCSLSFFLLYRVSFCLVNVWMRKEHVAWSDDLVPCLHFFFRSPLIIFACDCGVPNARWENCMTLFSVLPFIFCYTVFVGICMTCILIILKKSTGVAWQERNTLWLWGKKKPTEAKRNQQKTEMITRKRHPSINICDLASPILATLIWADQCTSFSCLCLCLFYRPLFNRYSLNAVSTELLALSFFYHWKRRNSDPYVD